MWAGLKPDFGLRKGFIIILAVSDNAKLFLHNHPFEDPGQDGSALVIVRPRA